MRAKSSPVWNYFSYSGLGKYAECNLCKKELSLGSEIKKRQTTFGLKRHLDYGHQVNWKMQSELNKPEKSTLDSDLILKESSPDFTEKHNLEITDDYGHQVDWEMQRELKKPKKSMLDSDLILKESSPPDFTEKLNLEITDDLIVDKIPQKLSSLMQSGNISVTHEKSIQQNNHEERNSSDFTEKINFEHFISLAQNNITVFKNKSKVFQPPRKEAVNRNSNSICHANNFKKCINEDHDEFKKARENQEDNMKTFICHICQEKFEHHAFKVHFPKCAGKQENLQVIKNVHEGQILSEICDKSFSNPGDLRKHVSQIDEEKGKCNVCGKVFPVHLKLHLKVHEGQTLCETCGKSFPNPGDLRNHVSLVHDEKGKCKVCGKYFSTPKNMRRHVEMVHEKIKNATCDHCGKLFSEKGGLKKHLNAYHYQSYKCETCQNYYYSQNSLNTHIHVVHEGHKDYSCESCGKLFAEASNLKRHIRGVHEGIKNHKCNTCGRAFFKKFSLQGHIRTVHEKLRVHICAYCTKAYSTAQHLRKHISVHEGQKTETTFMIVDV